MYYIYICNINKHNIHTVFVFGVCPFPIYLRPGESFCKSCLPGYHVNSTGASKCKMCPTGAGRWGDFPIHLALSIRFSGVIFLSN